MKPKFSVLTDLELTQRFNQGSTNAFEEIYERYWGQLYLHALRMLKDEEQAKDTVQEVFMYLLERRGSVEVQNIAVLLYMKVRHQVISLMRKQKTRKNYLEAYLDLEVFGEPADHLVREKQLQHLIEREIEALPPKVRVVFEASRKYYLSYQQIAEREHKSVETVKRQISVALGILRSKLGSYLLLQLMTLLLWYYHK